MKKLASLMLLSLLLGTSLHLSAHEEENITLNNEYQNFKVKRLSKLGLLMYMGIGWVPANNKNFPVLIEIVENLSKNMGISRPAVVVAEDHLFYKLLSYLLPWDDRFSDSYLSIHPNFSLIIIGNSLIKNLSKGELESLIAHEIAHLPGYDGIKKSGSLAASFIAPFFINSTVKNWQLRRLIRALQNDDPSLVGLSWYLSFFIEPLSSLTGHLGGRYYERSLEKKADFSTLELTKNKTLKDALVKREKLYRQKHRVWGLLRCVLNRALWWQTSFPSLWERKDYINEYKLS